MPKVRTGKTAKDRAPGATAKNLANKAERNTWMNDNNRTMQTFPRHTCNGKRNRYQVTGKNNTTVILRK